MSRTVRLIAPSFALLVLLGACRAEPDRGLDVAVIATPNAFAGIASDPGVRLSMAAQLVQAATAQGLVALDAQGQVVPALADRWIVTDDGDSYIFRLRDGTWPDGAPLNAEGVARALRQRLAALRETPLGLDLADIGEVRVMTDRVLELRLARPVPELLQLLAQPELGLRQRGRGSGPLDFGRDTTGKPREAGRAGLVRLAIIPPARIGLPAQSPDEAPPSLIRLHAMSVDAAAAAFGRGELSLVLGGRFTDLPRGQAAAGLSRRALQLDPGPGLFGLAIVSDTGPLAVADVREALSMAIDREGLAAALGLTGWSAATRLVPLPAAGGGPLGSNDGVGGAASTPQPVAAQSAWSSWSLDVRRSEAAARVARWRLRNGGAMPSLRLAWPVGPGADALYARLATDLAAVGVALQRVDESAPADLRLVDLVARYPGAQWYLNQVSCAARRTICSPQIEVRLAQARTERDPDRRAAMLAAVEAEVSASAIFIPLGQPVRWSLARPGLVGFASNAVGFHPLPPLILPAD